MGLEEHIKRLKELEARHLEIIQKMLEADGGNVSHIDLIGLAAINRSLSLTKAFLLMIETKNAIAGIPLIRLQLDSLMRFNACRFVDDTKNLIVNLLEDKPLNKIQSNDGQQLTDKYLHEKLSESYPEATKFYKITSGFIHLSGRHVFATVDKVDDKERTIDFKFDQKEMEWQSPHIEEAAGCFVEITEELLALAISYVLAKDKIDITDLY